MGGHILSLIYLALQGNPSHLSSVAAASFLLNVRTASHRRLLTATPPLRLCRGLLLLFLIDSSNNSSSWMVTFFSFPLQST